jgi:ParB-like chromosome segregation protein Spo0J
MRERGDFGEHAPLELRRSTDGKLELMAGHHRLEAARRAGLDDVVANVHSGLNEEAAADFARQSNSQAAQLTPIEYARAFKVEKNKGRSNVKIGEIYGGMTSNQVVDTLHLNSLSPRLQDHVQQGNFDPAKAIALGKAVERYSIPP